MSHCVQNFDWCKTFAYFFNKADRFSRDNNATKYLVLFGSEYCDLFFNRTSYLIGLKSVVKYVVSHNYAKIDIDVDDDLLLQKNIHFAKH